MRVPSQVRDKNGFKKKAVISNVTHQKEVR